MLRHVLIFPDGRTVATGLSLYNWKNVIKLTLVINQDLNSFALCCAYLEF